VYRGTGAETRVGCSSTFVVPSGSVVGTGNLIFTSVGSLVTLAWNPFLESAVYVTVRTNPSGSMTL